MARDKDQWTKILANKTPGEIAEFILQDLVGYQQDTKWRQDDRKHLAALVKALSDIRGAY